MGLRQFLGLDSPEERLAGLLLALQRIATAAERGQGGGYRAGAPLKAAEPPETAVSYTDEQELALEEARRLAYELSTGIRLGLLDTVPAPVDPSTGLPWGEAPPVRPAEGAGEKLDPDPGDGA